MRNSIFPAAIILALLFILNISLVAQTTATWQGGKPGRTTDWDCPANWSEGQVPDEFTRVIIPAGVHWHPVIKSSATPIDALLMEGGASLSIQDGATLTILCDTGIFDGVTLLGQIRNDGILEIGKAVEFNTAFLQRVEGKGTVIRQTASTDKLVRQR